MGRGIGRCGRLICLSRGSGRSYCLMRRMWVSVVMAESAIALSFIDMASPRMVDLIRLLISRNSPEARTVELKRFSIFALLLH